MLLLTVDHNLLPAKHIPCRITCLPLRSGSRLTQCALYKAALQADEAGIQVIEENIDHINNDIVVGEFRFLSQCHRHLMVNFIYRFSFCRRNCKHITYGRIHTFIEYKYDLYIFSNSTLYSSL